MNERPRVLEVFVLKRGNVIKSMCLFFIYLFFPKYWRKKIKIMLSLYCPIASQLEDDWKDGTLKNNQIFSYKVFKITMKVINTEFTETSLEKYLCNIFLA